jgi:hypothetical protein
MALFSVKAVVGDIAFQSRTAILRNFPAAKKTVTVGGCDWTSFYSGGRK